MRRLDISTDRGEVDRQPSSASTGSPVLETALLLPGVSGSFAVNSGAQRPVSNSSVSIFHRVLSAHCNQRAKTSRCHVPRHLDCHEANRKRKTDADATGRITCNVTRDILWKTFVVAITDTYRTQPSKEDRINTVSSLCTSRHEIHERNCSLRRRAGAGSRERPRRNERPSGGTTVPGKPYGRFWGRMALAPIQLDRGDTRSHHIFVSRVGGRSPSRDFFEFLIGIFRGKPYGAAGHWLRLWPISPRHRGARTGLRARVRGNMAPFRGQPYARRDRNPRPIGTGRRAATADNVGNMHPPLRRRTFVAALAVRDRAPGSAIR